MSKELELFSKLLQTAGVFKDSDLIEAVTCAKRLEIPLERALTMLKVASDRKLQPAITAKEMVAAGKISLEEAGRILRQASQHDMSFEDALSNRVTHDPSLHLSSGKVIHPLAEFLLASKLVTPDQLNQTVHKSQTMNLPLGKTLIVNRFISRWALGEVLNAAYLVKENLITQEQALNLLHDSIQHRISVFQVLFESGNYHIPSADAITLPELLCMADCLTEADCQDIQEHALVEKEGYTQIITKYKLVESTLVESAVSLLEMTGDYLKPFQAAEALKQVKVKKIPIYQAIAELKPPPQVPQPELRLGDLLVEAGIVSREAIEKVVAGQQRLPTQARIGKLLLAAHLIDDTNLYNALRCQSLFRAGIMSAQQTVTSLSCAHDEKLKLEDVFIQYGIYAPIRMQWNWQ